MDDIWVLEVPGRVSGRLRQSLVKPHDGDGQQYLVALDPQAQWAHNLRAAPAGGCPETPWLSSSRRR